MIAAGGSERTRLFVSTDAEVRAANLAESVETAKTSIFEYLSQKVPNLPKKLFELDAFDDDSGLLTTERVTGDNLNIWATKLNEPDATIAGRSWSLELAIGQYAGQVRFASRLSCFSRHLDFDIEPAVPRVYRNLASQNVLYGDGIRLSRNPVDISSEEEVSWLVALINNQRRWRNVIVLSSNETGVCALDPFSISDQLCGTAHVVRIFPDASFELSRLIRKFHSVFNSGIRIYRPTSQVETDEATKHSLFTKNQLARFDLRKLQINIAYDAFRASVERNVSKQTIPTFVQIRSANASLRLARIQENATKLDVTTIVLDSLSKGQS